MIQQGVSSFIFNKPECNGYSHVNVKDVMFHIPQHDEYIMFSGYVRKLKQRLKAVIIYQLIIIESVLLFFLISIHSVMTLIPMAVFALILTGIYFLLRGLFAGPYEIAKGRVLGYGAGQRIYIAVDSERKIVCNLGRLRGEKAINDNAEVVILHYKTGYYICETFEN